MSAAYDILEEIAPQDVFSAAQQHFEDLVNELGQAPEIFALDSDELEQHLHLQGRELLRLLLDKIFALP